MKSSVDIFKGKTDGLEEVLCFFWPELPNFTLLSMAILVEKNRVTLFSNHQLKNCVNYLCKL